MAMTAVVTTLGDKYTGLRGYKVVFTWTSDGSGDATATTTETITGLIRTVITNPGATAPTDNYDVYIRDSNAANLSAAQCEDRDTANSEAVTLTTPAMISDTMTCVVANAGDTKSGVVTVLVSGV